MFKIEEKIQRLNATEIVASYLAKFSLGVGFGLLWGAQKKGWVFIVLAVVVGLPAEMKFWRNG